MVVVVVVGYWLFGVGSWLFDVVVVVVVAVVVVGGGGGGGGGGGMSLL